MTGKTHTQLDADHCQSWKHTDPQANKSPHTLQRKQDLRNQAEKAQPKFQPAKQVLAKAEADSNKANKQAADSLLVETAAVDQNLEAAGQLKEANNNLKIAQNKLKEAQAIRPRKSDEYNAAVATAEPAVTAANKRVAVTRKEQQAAAEVKSKAAKNYNAAAQAANTKTQVLRQKKRSYNDAFREYYGKLNQVDWGVNYPFCTVVDKDDTDASLCTKLCASSFNGVSNDDGVKRCDSINVVPYRLPSTTGWPGLVNPAIPDLTPLGFTLS